MTPDEIKSCVYTLRKSKKSIEKLKEEHFQFYEKYPKLFAAATDPMFPLTFLETMLSQLEMLNKKETDIDTADKEVYGELQKTYIDPVIKT